GGGEGGGQGGEPYRMPPWGSSVSPWRLAPAGREARKSAASAICSGWSIRERSGGAATASHSGVSVAPADRTPTRTPCERISSASTLERPRTPYLVAV